MTADDLYALPPGEFTPARDALAKELLAAGDREAAAQVKQLRRPTVAAWAINRAAREHPDALRDLLGAGAALRRAHERLLAGKGDRAVLREATEHERSAVGAFAAVVSQSAAAAGQPLSDAAMTKVRETLHAATVDDEVRAALEAGRLEREATAIGGTGAFAATAAVARQPARKGQRERPATGGRAAERAAAATREAAVKALREADRTAARAERECEAARRRVDRAEATVERAEEALDDARAALDRERERLADAQRDVREAKAALGAAQSALDEI